MLCRDNAPCIRSSTFCSQYASVSPSLQSGWSGSRARATGSLCPPRRDSTRTFDKPSVLVFHLKPEYQPALLLRVYHVPNYSMKHLLRLRRSRKLKYLKLNIRHLYATAVQIVTAPLLPPLALTTGPIKTELAWHEFYPCYNQEIALFSACRRVGGFHLDYTPFSRWGFLEVWSAKRLIIRPPADVRHPKLQRISLCVSRKGHISQRKEKM